MKVILCEERREVLESLEQQMLLVREELNFNGVVKTCGRNLLEAELAREACDLLIMGVGEGDEAELVCRLKSRYPQLLVIWEVSSAQEVPELDESFILGWFICPLDRIRLGKLFSRFLYERARSAGDEYYYVKNSVGTVQTKISYDKIEFAESQGNQILLHLMGGQVLRIYERMKNLEQELADRRFLKCHQSYIVNMDHVRSIGDTFVMKSGALVQIRQREKKQIREQYLSFLVERR